jgi:hypothetical protein
LTLAQTVSWASTGSIQNNVMSNDSPTRRRRFMEFRDAINRIVSSKSRAISITNHPRQIDMREGSQVRGNYQTLQGDTPQVL